MTDPDTNGFGYYVWKNFSSFTSPPCIGDCGDYGERKVSDQPREKPNLSEKNKLSNDSYGYKWMISYQSHHLFPPFPYNIDYSCPSIPLKKLP